MGEIPETIVGQKAPHVPESPRRRRFSLATLLLLPVILSPLFMSFAAVMNVIADRERSRWGLDIVVGNFAYALALTYISYRRRRAVGTFNTRRPFYWSLVRGALYGALFFSLLTLPLVILDKVVYAKRFGLTFRQFLAGDWIKVGLFQAGMALIIGTIIGAAAGGILGLFLPRPQVKATQR